MVHIFSRLLRIDAGFKLSKFLENVPAEAADDLVRQVQKSVETFANTFGPEESSDKKLPTEKAGDGEVSAP